MKAEITLNLIDQCASGGLLLFAGGLDPLVAGPGALLTGLIDVMTKAVPVGNGKAVKMSHSAICMPSRGRAPYIYESTKGGGIPSGPQRSDLAALLAEYAKGHGHAWLFPFMPQFEPDWAAVEAAALHMIALREAGLMPYNVQRLFNDAEQRSLIFDLLAMPAAGIIAYEGARSKGVVCSEEAALLIEAGGVVAKLAAAGIAWMPNVAPPGQPIGNGPVDLGLTPMFLPAVQLL
jgi:hypothetical protein